jgi:hypothetical protein
MLTHRIQLAAVLIAATFMMSAHGAAAVSGAGSANETQFVQLDANSDGFITLGEWKGGRLTFDSLDRDGDSVLTRTEFFVREQRYRSREERFRDLDADRDGRVSAREWKWGPETLAVLDHDHDGFLTRREFRCRKAEAEPSENASATRP